MLAKIDILNQQDLGERVYKWDAYYVQDLQKHEWERSPVEIETVNKQKIYSLTNKGFAVWENDAHATALITRAKVKFDKIAPTYIYIYTGVSATEAYAAIVPFDRFMAQLRYDNNITAHILTKTWLDRYSVEIKKSTITESVTLNIRLIYKRPVIAMPKDNEMKIYVAQVGVKDINKYYNSIAWEFSDSNNQQYPAPNYENSLVFATPFADTENLNDVLDYVAQDEDWLPNAQQFLIGSVQSFKGQTGFGKFEHSRDIYGIYDTGRIVGGVLANERFLTLGLANENYAFEWVKRNGKWCYAIRINLAYMSPDVQFVSLHDVYTQQLKLDWFSYPLFVNDIWTSNNLYSNWTEEWMYMQNAYSVYDYHYVSELDDTDSFGPVWGRISVNKFEPRLYTYAELMNDYESLKRIAGYTTGAPAYLKFAFGSIIDTATAAASKEPIFEWAFWKEFDMNLIKEGWRDIQLATEYLPSGYRTTFPSSANYYLPFDEIERFENYESIMHTYPTSATASYNPGEARLNFNENKLSIFFDNYEYVDCVAIDYDTYENIIGIETAEVESVNSFNPNAYPKNGVMNGWMYTYKGYTTIVNSDTGIKAFTITSNNINAYPKDGIKNMSGTYYWFKFAGLVRSKVETYYPNVIFDCTSRQSIGSSSSFAIGNVGGGTCEFTVLKPYTEVIKYKNFDINVYYTYDSAFGSNYYLDGQYTIKEIEEIGPNKVRVMAYDNCYRLDCSAMPLIENIQNHTTIIKKLFYYVCAYCDIPYYGNELILNGELSTGDLSTLDNNVTCRQLLEWVAQISGSVVVCDKTGFLVPKNLDKPLLSRGSYDAINRNLKVSKIPIIIPVGIKVTSAANETFVVGELTEWENRVLDWTNNPLFKNNSTVNAELAAQNVLTQFTKIEDVYSFECDLADNRYGVECGDSWVVESADIEPRRGIITDKTIAASGMTLVSSVGIESEYAPFYSKEQATINLLINQVDSVFMNLEFDGIQLVDPMTEEVLETLTQHYDITLENSVIEYDGKLFDLSSQWTNLIVNPEEWVEIMVDGNIWKVRIYHGYLQIYDANSLPEMFRKIDNFNIVFTGQFGYHSLEMTPAQLAEATELTVNYYQRHYYNFNQYFTRECGAFTVKFPKAIGAYVYEAYRNVPNLVDGSGEDFVYAGYNYEAYSTWEPTIKQWYPDGLINIEGAYPKGLQIFIQTNTTTSTTTLVIKIDCWAVQANSIPIITPPSPWLITDGYIHVDGYKLMSGDPHGLSEPQDFADITYFTSNLPVAATITKTAYTSAIGINGVGAANEWFGLYKDNDYVGVLCYQISLENYGTDYATGNAQLYYIDRYNVDTTMNKVSCNLKQEWDFSHPTLDNPVLNLSFDLAIAPKVKNLIISGELADFIGASSAMVLTGELPFDVNDRPNLYNLDGDIITFNWDDVISDGHIKGASTLNESLGFVINGYWTVPEEIKWDFASDFYNQLIYVYYSLVRDINFSFKYYNGQFHFTQVYSSAEPDVFYEPETQTLILGSIMS